MMPIPSLVCASTFNCFIIFHIASPKILMWLLAVKRKQNNSIRNTNRIRTLEEVVITILACRKMYKRFRNGRQTTLRYNYGKVVFGELSQIVISPNTNVICVQISSVCETVSSSWVLIVKGIIGNHASNRRG